MPSLKRTEHDEQSFVIQWAKLNEGNRPCLKWLHAIPNGARRSKWERGRAISEGMKSGICDLFLPFPSQSKHGLYIEMKAKRGTIRPEQKEFMAYAIQNGYRVELCYSADAAVEALEDYLELA